MNRPIVLIKNILRPFYKAVCDYRIFSYRRNQVKRLISIARSKSNRLRIFYLGITNHSNLGDMGQYYCIQLWLKSNFPDAMIYEFECDVVIDQRFGFVQKLKNQIRNEDLIVFQSGYTTQDLGGNHEYMHRLIIDNIPDAKILMMPQTVFFKNPENKERTANSYNQAKRMLFLARDTVSFTMALEMFPDICVKLIPDIVTSLIGHYNYQHNRSGVLICRRNDGEKFYSEEEIFNLKRSIEKEEHVTISDTKILVPYKKIRKNPKQFIEAIIEDYSKYKLIVTDRFHGTIFSLVANTPVIVLKTTDHKVITGANWFKEVYGEYVFLAESMNDAYNTAKLVLSSNYKYKLDPYFDNEYYGKLKAMMNKVIT